MRHIRIYIYLHALRLSRLPSLVQHLFWKGHRPTTYTGRLFLQGNSPTWASHTMVRRVTEAFWRMVQRSLCCSCAVLSWFWCEVTSQSLVPMRWMPSWDAKIFGSVLSGGGSAGSEVKCPHSPWSRWGGCHWLQWLQWGWPSARLFGWSAADLSRPDTNTSVEVDAN